MAIRAAVLSDTHGVLRPEVLTAAAGCDLILHAGDFDNPWILSDLQDIAPVYGVRGNNDGEWAGQLPGVLRFRLEDCRFLMVHNKWDVPRDLTEVDAVIFGHTHQYREEMLDGRLWLNPGSCGRRRFDLGLSFVIMTVKGKEIRTEKVTIPVT